MSVGKTHKLYLIGATPEDVIKNSEPYFYQKAAQEGVTDEENIYTIDVTLFASRLRKVKKWKDG